MTNLLIEPWDSAHHRWAELIQIVTAEQQVEWFTDQYEWHRSNHILVAQIDEAICGFLRFVTQVIGADADCEPLMLDETPLIEAKVLAFGVLARYRRQGIGRALQEYALYQAAQLQCYQLRSHSSGENRANHHLKLSMGFAVHPIIRGPDRAGVYFVMPLQNAPNE